MQIASLIKTLITQTPNDEESDSTRPTQRNSAPLSGLIVSNSTNTVSSPRVGDSYGLPVLGGGGESVPWPGSVVHLLVVLPNPCIS